MPIFESEERDREVADEVLSLIYAEALEFSESLVRTDGKRPAAALDAQSDYVGNLANGIAYRSLEKRGYKENHDGKWHLPEGVIDPGPPSAPASVEATA